jgi:hypothetical protein
MLCRGVVCCDVRALGENIASPRRPKRLYRAGAVADWSLSHGALSPYQRSALAENCKCAHVLWTNGGNA